MAFNLTTSQSRTNETSIHYSDEQISNALIKLKLKAKDNNDINIAIEGLRCANPKIAEKCRQTLSKIEPTKFNSSNILTIIGTFGSKDDFTDEFCISLLAKSALPFTPVFGSLRNKLALKIQLARKGLEAKPEVIKNILTLPDGIQGVEEMYKPAAGDTFEYVVTKKGIGVKIGKRTGEISQEFTMDCFIALMGKIVDLCSKQVQKGGFYTEESTGNPLAQKLIGLLYETSDRATAALIAKDNAIEISSKISEMLSLLEQNPIMPNNRWAFQFMEDFLSGKNTGIVTKSHFLSVLSMIDKYDNDSLIQRYVEKNKDKLSHDEIEIFKKGMANRDKADVYAKIYRHIGRHYAKLFKKEDLDIFIDNIDQKKPEYCSGETCGCKARAIADLANLMPELFEKKHVEVAINTFQTSLTYQDGAAMILGYLAVKEPDKFGDMCVNGLLDRLNDPVFFGAGIISLYVALNQPEKFGKQICNAYVKGLASQNSRVDSLWALEKLLDAHPELMKGIGDQAKELMIKYPLTNRQKLDAYYQYWSYNGYFNLGIFPDIGKTVNDLSNLVSAERKQSEVK